MHWYGLSLCVFWCEQENHYSERKTCHNVYIEKVSPIVCFQMGNTMKWFLFSVCHHMPYKITIIWETHVTLVTNIWFISSVCLIICIIRFSLCEKVMSHWLQWYGFSPVWVLIWPIRSLLVEKLLSHSLHWYSFYTVWVLIWPIRSVKLSFTVKALSHSRHWCGFSPVCLFKWF